LALIFLRGKSLIAAMGTNLDIDELRRLQRLCLEQAEEAGTPEGPAAAGCELSGGGRENC
jgi:hypothetical protein